jgi:hypothetical protein
LDLPLLVSGFGAFLLDVGLMRTMTRGAANAKKAGAGFAPAFPNFKTIGRLDFSLGLRFTHQADKA